MKISTTGINLIKEFEDIRLSVYADSSGYPTVGWGHLLTDKRKYTPDTQLSNEDSKYELKKAGLSNSSSITKDQADKLLKSDISTVEVFVNDKNKEHYNKMNQNQFDALSSLTFNIPKALKSDDVKKLLDCSMTYSDYGAPMSNAQLKEMAEKVTKAFTWTIAGGKRSKGLVKRRNKEMDLFCKGLKYSYNKISY